MFEVTFTNTKFRKEMTGSGTGHELFLQHLGVHFHEHTETDDMTECPPRIFQIIIKGFRTTKTILIYTHIQENAKFPVPDNHKLMFSSRCKERWHAFSLQTSEITEDRLRTKHADKGMLESGNSARRHS